MADLLANIEGQVAKLITATRRFTESSTDAKFRQSQYGEMMALGLLTPQQVAAVEGSYYTWAQEGTRNTGVTLTAATGATYSATQAILVVANTNAIGGPDFILDEFEIKYDAVNTAGVGGFLYYAIDDGNRYSSGGAAMTGYNADGAQPQGVLVYTGAITAGAATNNVRDVGQNVYLNGVGVATPILTVKIRFGGNPIASSSVAVPATTGVEAIMNGPAIVVRPGKCLVVNEFQTSRNASGTGEFWVRGVVR